MNATLVIGHINPDTDTTCSAIAYAWYLKGKGQDAEAVVAGELNKETTYVLEHFGVATPRIVESLAGEKLVIVDTNNPEELLLGYAEAEITAILDHHKLVGGLSTAEPISVTIRPVACTATVLLEAMGVVELPKEIAGVMLASILSDTLNFTSPTTTDEDRAAAQKLAGSAGVDGDELAAAMFAAKSDLTGMSPEDIITVDSKVFTLGGQRIRISSLETTLPANAIAMREALEGALAVSKEKDGLDAAFLFVVDIIKSAATVIVPSQAERDIAAKAFSVPFTGDVLELPGVVSRKKQITPQIEAAVS